MVVAMLPMAASISASPLTAGPGRISSGAYRRSAVALASRLTCRTALSPTSRPASRSGS
jgi:hypothetical protein